MVSLNPMAQVRHIKTTVALVLFSGLLIGCSSNYSIYTVKGDVYQTKGAPMFADGGYEFTDVQGNYRRISLAQVRMLK